MKSATREAIETFAKKAGFHKHATKEIWMENRIPNMKIIDLSIEPPWIGIGASVAQRIEAEDSGIALIQDYKEKILQIYNSPEHQNEKSPEAGSHIPVPPQDEVSSLPPISSDVALVSGDESYHFICSKCMTPISAEQRAATVKAVGKALCEACIHKTAVELAEKMKPKEELKAPEPKPEPAKETKKKPAGKKKDEKEPKEEKIGEVKATQMPAPEPIAPVMCKDCGFELSHIRALEYQICEGCAEKRRIDAEKNIPLKLREGIKMNEKANVPAVKSDHEQDMEIEKAKAKRYLEGQGGSYKVNGNDVPDSARIQQIANEENISVMILESQQNEEFARVRVRGILKGQSVDDEVWVDFDTELKLLMMEFIRKNEGVLDHFDGLNPVFKEGAKIRNFDGSFTDAKYALVHAMLTLRKFAVRSAGTKAAKRVQMKLMNKEFREKEEIADEQAEQDLVNSKKRKQ